MFELLFELASKSWAFGAMFVCVLIIWTITVGFLLRAEIIMYQMRKEKRKQ